MFSRRYGISSQFYFFTPLSAAHRVSLIKMRVYLFILSGCLFRINEDHCEFKDLSKKRAEIVTKLHQKMIKYRKALVKQMTNNFDPNSNPKYFHNYWSPWVSDLVTKNIWLNSGLMWIFRLKKDSLFVRSIVLSSYLICYICSKCDLFFKLTNPTFF